jgi:GGDEF domain-containing protein
VIGRIGPDRFAVVAVDASEATISRIRERVEDAVGEANAFPDGVGNLAIGATPLAPTETASVDELISRASLAIAGDEEET